MAGVDTKGLAGVSAGETRICTVGKEGVGLTYFGYTIQDLAAKATFEEVAYLLLHGELPNRAQLDAYKKELASRRELPDALKIILERLPGDAPPMDVLQTGCSALGSLEPENESRDQREIANRLMASFAAPFTAARMKRPWRWFRSFLRPKTRRKG